MASLYIYLIGKRSGLVQRNEVGIEKNIELIDL